MGRMGPGRRRRHRTEPGGVGLRGRKKIETATILTVLVVLVAVISGGIPFLAGKYIEFNSPGPFDSGAYVYSAQRILTGARLGVDEIPSARPGTLLVNVIGVKLFGFSEFGPKFIQAILQAGALVIMFIAVGRLFGSLAGCISVAVTAFYLSAPVIAKFGNVKEQYMISLMVMAGACFILFQLSGKWPWALACGAASVNICFFKATGISVIAGMVVYEFLALITRRSSGVRIARDVGCWLGGAAVGIIPLLMLYGWQGQIDQLFPKLFFVGLKFLAMITVFVVVLWYVIRVSAEHRLCGRLKEVSWRIYAAGVAAVLLMAIVFACYVAWKHDGEVGEFFVGWLGDTPFVSIPMNIYYKLTAAWQRIVATAGFGRGYLGSSWTTVSIGALAERIFRYYRILAVPMLLGVAAAVGALLRWGLCRLRREHLTRQDALAAFLVVWWILDVVFIWLSPRSYEQYYLPLNASAAMLGSYMVWLYVQRFDSAAQKAKWLGMGIAAGVCMIALSWQVWIGLSKSPDTGAPYRSQAGQPSRRRGYVQSLERVANRKKGAVGPWEVLGEYIRGHSKPADTIYVWGWFPGIYVQAQRLAPVPRAFESDMHLKKPSHLASKIVEMVEALKKAPPKFIVDSRKVHFPNDRPPLELWPIADGGHPIRDDAAYVARFDLMYKEMLAEKITDASQADKYRPLTLWDHYEPWARAMPDEAMRYEAMGPLRDFVRGHYRIVRAFGSHMLFELKKGASVR